MARYRVEGTWTTLKTTTVVSLDDAPLATLDWQVNDLRDTRTNHLYEDGAIRIRVSNVAAGLQPLKTKTFHGETAHSYAENRWRENIQIIRRLTSTTTARETRNA